MSTSQTKEQSINGKVIVFGFFLSILFISILFVRHISQNQTDLTLHTNLVNAIFTGTKVIPHFLWHLLVYAISSLTGISLIRGAIVTTGLCITLLALVKYYCFLSFLKEKNYSVAVLFLLTVISMIAMPIYIPWFNKNLYLGQGGSGIWHSPTLLLLKPIAFLSLLLTMQFLDQEKMKTMFLALFFLILSIFAKPNFILIFIPSLISYLFMMRKNYNFDRKIVLFLVSSIVLSFCILAVQYYITYSAKTNIQELSHIVVSPGSVWKFYSPSIMVSILITLAFPIFVLIGSKEQSKFLIFSWLLVFFALFQAYVFAEALGSGQIKMDGNFFWGYNCAIDFVFVFSMIHYLKFYQHYKLTFLGNLLLTLQGISGIIYLKHIILDHSIL